MFIILIVVMVSKVYTYVYVQYYELSPNKTKPRRTKKRMVGEMPYNSDYDSSILLLKIPMNSWSQLLPLLQKPLEVVDVCEAVFCIALPLQP